MPFYKSSNGKILRCSNGKIARTCHCALPEIQLAGTIEWEVVAGVAMTPPGLNLDITNVGTDPSVLTWDTDITLDAGIAGLVTALPTSGTANFGETDTSVLSLDASAGIAAGDYAGEIEVSDSVIPSVTPQTVPIVVRSVATGSYPGLMYIWYRDITNGITYGPTGYPRGWPPAIPVSPVHYYSGVFWPLYMDMAGVWQLYLSTAPPSRVPHDMVWVGADLKSSSPREYLYFSGGVWATFCSSNAADTPPGW